jgi:hypothetical protein
MYDKDGTGELEEDEFVEVLVAAGFSRDESCVIFSNVDTDNGGSVGLAEFEAWWIESQRQQVCNSPMHSMLSVHSSPLFPYAGVQQLASLAVTCSIAKGGCPDSPDVQVEQGLDKVGL